MQKKKFSIWVWVRGRDYRCWITATEAEFKLRTPAIYICMKNPTENYLRNLSWALDEKKKMRRIFNEIR